MAVDAPTMATFHAPAPPTFALGARALAAAVAARLGPVCADWPPAQFAALVADVVRFRQRWAAWDAVG